MAVAYKVDDSFDRSMLAGASCAFGVFDGVHAGASVHHRRGGEICSRDGDALVRHHVRRRSRRGVSPGMREEAHDQRAPHRRAHASRRRWRDRAPVLLSFAASSPTPSSHPRLPVGFPHVCIVGADFQIRREGGGTVETLAVFGKKRGMKAFGHELYMMDGAPVTATRIRRLLADGAHCRGKLLASAIATKSRAW